MKRQNSSPSQQQQQQQPITSPGQLQNPAPEVPTTPDRGEDILMDLNNERNLEDLLVDSESQKCKDLRAQVGQPFPARGRALSRLRRLAALC